MVMHSVLLVYMTPVANHLVELVGTLLGARGDLPSLSLSLPHHRHSYRIVSLLEGKARVALKRPPIFQNKALLLCMLW